MPVKRSAKSRVTERRRKRRAATQFGAKEAIASYNRESERGSLLDFGTCIMLFRLGRSLQLIGMIVAPVGMAGNIVRPEKVSVHDSLAVAAVGGAVFVAGWLLLQLVRPK